jgi:16S rRNA pseudouridine516 synthase
MMVQNGPDATLRAMRIDQILYSQGFGSRRECAALLARGEVQVASQIVTSPEAEFDADGLTFHVSGTPWPFHALALLMLHKPAGFECSRQPQQHRSVMSLLPLPLRQRGVQPVGRLDEDTTGLLLLTDDGALLHRLTSPRHHVPKVYEVTARHPVDAAQIEALRAGVQLRDDPKPARAEACEATGERSLRLTIAEGRYHQVKRMLAAVGNRVDALHRSAFGALRLPADLAPGQWRWVEPGELSAAPAAP